METPKQALSTANVNRDHLDHVQSQIVFARRTSDERAPEVVLSGLDMAANPVRHCVLPPMVRHNVTIRNARPITHELSLDREGFTLIQRKVSCVSERDPNVLQDRYLKEMVPFIQSYFNASWVVARRKSILVRGASGRSRSDGEPIVWAHLDFTPVAGPMLAALVDQSEGVPTRPYSRLIIAQTWHALSPPPQDFPLAFCDGASVRDTDSVVVNYRFFDTTTKLSVMHFNPAQRWYYFPDMAADEFILFKGYDSEVSCNAKAAHAAFDNRRAYPNAKPRESIEGRFFVYYA